MLVTDLGLEKGKTPLSDESVDKVVAMGREVLAG
jgi:hypothetical protein